MSDFINDILTGDLVEILGDLYAPTVAAVAASWAVIAFAGIVQAFSNLFLALFNLKK